MDDLQSTLKDLLDHPEELEKLAETAASFLEPDHSQQSTDPIDLGKMLSVLQNPASGPSDHLIQALSPFLSESRRRRLEKASRLAKLSNIAELALRKDEEYG